MKGLGCEVLLTVFICSFSLVYAENGEVIQSKSKDHGIIESRELDESLKENGKLQRRNTVLNLESVEQYVSHETKNADSITDSTEDSVNEEDKHKFNSLSSENENDTLLNTISQNHSEIKENQKSMEKSEFTKSAGNFDFEALSSKVLTKRISPVETELSPKDSEQMNKEFPEKEGIDKSSVNFSSYAEREELDRDLESDVASGKYNDSKQILERIDAQNPNQRKNSSDGVNNGDTIQENSDHRHVIHYVLPHQSNQPGSVKYKVNQMLSEKTIANKWNDEKSLGRTPIPGVYPIYKNNGRGNNFNTDISPLNLNILTQVMKNKQTYEESSSYEPSVKDKEYSQIKTPPNNKILKNINQNPLTLKVKGNPLYKMANPNTSPKISRGHSQYNLGKDRIRQTPSIAGNLGYKNQNDGQYNIKPKLGSKSPIPVIHRQKSSALSSSNDKSGIKYNFPPSRTVAFRNAGHAQGLDQAEYEKLFQIVNNGDQSNSQLPVYKENTRKFYDDLNSGYQKEKARYEDKSDCDEIEEMVIEEHLRSSQNQYKNPRQYEQIGISNDYGKANNPAHYAQNYGDVNAGNINAEKSYEHNNHATLTSGKSPKTIKVSFSDGPEKVTYVVLCDDDHKNTKNINEGSIPKYAKDSGGILGYTKSFNNGYNFQSNQNSEKFSNHKPAYNVKQQKGDANLHALDGGKFSNEGQIKINNYGTSSRKQQYPTFQGIYKGSPYRIVPENGLSKGISYSEVSNRLKNLGFYANIGQNKNIASNQPQGYHKGHELKQVKNQYQNSLFPIVLLKDTEYFKKLNQYKDLSLNPVSGLSSGYSSDGNKGVTFQYNQGHKGNQGNFKGTQFESEQAKEYGYKPQEAPIKSLRPNYELNSNQQLHGSISQDHSKGYENLNTKSQGNYKGSNYNLDDKQGQYVNSDYSIKGIQEQKKDLPFPFQNEGGQNKENMYDLEKLKGELNLALNYHDGGVKFLELTTGPNKYTNEQQGNFKGTDFNVENQKKLNYDNNQREKLKGETFDTELNHYKGTGYSNVQQANFNVPESFSKITGSYEASKHGGGFHNENSKGVNNPFKGTNYEGNGNKKKQRENISSAKNFLQKHYGKYSSPSGIGQTESEHSDYHLSHHNGQDQIKVIEYEQGIVGDIGNQQIPHKNINGNINSPYDEREIHYSIGRNRDLKKEYSKGHEQSFEKGNGNEYSQGKDYIKGKVLGYVTGQGISDVSGGQGIGHSIGVDFGYVDGKEVGNDNGKSTGYGSGQSHDSGKDVGYGIEQDSGYGGEQEAGYANGKSGYGGGQGHGNGKGSGYGSGQGIGEGQGSGYGRGQGHGNGKGSGYGDGQGIGERQGSGYGRGQGHGNGKGSGYGRGQGHGNGKGSGYGDGQGIGDGQGSGYGRGQGHGNGKGSGYGDGQGIGEGQGLGYGVGQGKGYGIGKGSGNGGGQRYGNGKGSGYDSGQGQGNGQGPGYINGQGQGNGKGSGYGGGQGHGNGKGSGYGDGQGIGEGQGSGYGRGQGHGNGKGSGYGGGQGHGNGKGSGYGSGQGIGEGQGSGYGGGQGHDNGKGSEYGGGQGHGNGKGTGYGVGQSHGNGKSSGYGGGQGKGHGEGQGLGYGVGQGKGYGIGKGSGYGGGQGTSHGDGEGIGFGEGQGSGFGGGQGIGQSNGKGIGYGVGKGIGNGEGKGYEYGGGQGIDQSQGSVNRGKQGAGHGNGAGSGYGGVQKTGYTKGKESEYDNGYGNSKGSGYSVEQANIQISKYGSGQVIVHGNGQSIRYGEGKKNGQGNVKESGYGANHNSQQETGYINSQGNEYGNDERPKYDYEQINKYKNGQPEAYGSGLSNGYESIRDKGYGDEETIKYGDVHANAFGNKYGNNYNNDNGIKKEIEYDNAYGNQHGNGYDHGHTIEYANSQKGEYGKKPKNEYDHRPKNVYYKDQGNGYGIGQGIGHGVENTNITSNEDIVYVLQGGNPDPQDVFQISSPVEETYRKNNEKYQSNSQISSEGYEHNHHSQKNSHDKVSPAQYIAITNEEDNPSNDGSYYYMINEESNPGDQKDNLNGQNNNQYTTAQERNLDKAIPFEELAKVGLRLANSVIPADSSKKTIEGKISFGMEIKKKVADDSRSIEYRHDTVKQ